MKRTIFPPLETKPSKETVRLLPQEGQLYKVNLHAHSTLSDGSFSPAELKELYQARGYHAVAFTDHRICAPHPELTDDKFVALAGVEVDFVAKDETGYTRKIIHMNGLARDPNKACTFGAMPLDLELVNQVISGMKQDGFLVTVNHPVFSDMSTDDLLQLHGMHGVEVCNSVSTMFNNYSDDTAFFEYFLRAGGRAMPIAADDCHLHYEDGTPCADYFESFTVIKAPELTYDALVQGMEAGALFASTGPMFENLWLDGDTLHVECSPVCGVFVHGKYLSYKSVQLERTDCITHAELDVSGLRAISPYIWVQLRDSRGRKAWAVPFWFD